MDFSSLLCESQGMVTINILYSLKPSKNTILEAEGGAGCAHFLRRSSSVYTSLLLLIFTYLEMPGCTMRRAAANDNTLCRFEAGSLRQGTKSHRQHRMHTRRSPVRTRPSVPSPFLPAQLSQGDFAQFRISLLSVTLTGGLVAVTPAQGKKKNTIQSRFCKAWSSCSLWNQPF